MPFLSNLLKHNLIVSHKSNQYNVTRFKDLQVILNTEKGRNDIFLIVQKSGKEKLLKFTFNIIEEKKKNIGTLLKSLVLLVSN